MITKFALGVAINIFEVDKGWGFPVFPISTEMSPLFTKLLMEIILKLFIFLILLDHYVFPVVELVNCENFTNLILLFIFTNLVYFLYVV